MKKTISIMVVTVCIVFAGVSSKTLYRSDMYSLNADMASEHSGVTVNCFVQDSVVNTEVIFESDWIGSDYQARQIGYAIGAVVQLSRRVSWYSDNVFISFRDLRFICSMPEAENFCDNAEEWSDEQISTWLLNNFREEKL